MPSWKKNRLRLKADHQWKARPGHKIFVADRGAVRFDIPETWVVVPESDCVRLYDKQPPDDDCTLGVSYLRLPPMAWSELPLKKLLEEAVKETERELSRRVRSSNCTAPTWKSSGARCTSLTPRNAAKLSRGSAWDDAS